MAEEQTGIVLGKLAPPFIEGMVWTKRGFEDEKVFRKRRAVEVATDPYNYRNDPLYFAAENKRKRRRV